MHSRLDFTIALHLLPYISFRLGFTPQLVVYRLQSWVGCLDHCYHSKSRPEGRGFIPNFSVRVPQPEVGGCCPNLSKIEASATKLIAKSTDV